MGAKNGVGLCDKSGRCESRPIVQEYYALENGLGYIKQIGGIPEEGVVYIGETRVEAKKKIYYVGETRVETKKKIYHALERR